MWSTMTVLLAPCVSAADREVTVCFPQNYAISACFLSGLGTRCAHSHSIVIECEMLILCMRAMLAVTAHLRFKFALSRSMF